MNWYVNHRMEWIAETLRVFGFINRDHLKRKFGISTPQASMDLNNFQRLHPGIVRYDIHQKKYITDIYVADENNHIPGGKD